MELLEEKIRKYGELRPGGILKVDNFLNHQIDIALMQEIGKEFARLFDGVKVDKILTIEASGIGIACIASQYFGNVPVVFAKKSEAKNLDADVYATTVHSFTKDKDFTVRVSQRYIGKGEKILIIDDFLANGEAALGLTRLVRMGGAEVAGIGICIEKAFQKGGKTLLGLGLKLESLAIVDIKDDGTINFIRR